VRALHLRVVLTFAVLPCLLSCGASGSTFDAFADIKVFSGAPTREAASDILQGTGSFKGEIRCGESRWFAFDASPFTRGEVRVKARLPPGGTVAGVDVSLVEEHDKVLADRSQQVRAIAPEHEIIVTPFQFASRGEDMPKRLWVRVMAEDPCAPVTFVVWFRQPALVGP